MATIKGINYSSPRNINLKGVSAAKGSTLRFNQTSTANPLDSSSYGLYVNSSGSLIYSSAGTSTTLGAPGSGAAASWDSIFDGDQTLTVDTSTFTIEGTQSNGNDVLTVTNVSGSSGDAIQITNVGSGYDIEGSSDTWHITKDGVAVLEELTIDGTEGSNIFTVTKGDTRFLDGAVAITDDDDARSEE